MNFNRFLSSPSSNCCVDTVYNKPNIVILATGVEIVLYPGMIYYEYIFTSGTTQNFSTTVLTNLSQAAGYFIKIKNGKGQGNGDIAISINGVFAGTLYPNTNGNNAGTATLYWNGTNLFFY